MRKQFFLLFCICMLVHTALSQKPVYNFRLTVTPIVATCQGNGELHCGLEYDDGLSLEQVRYYYIPLSGLDSIVETSMPVVTHLRPGDYKVKVSALCGTGLPGADAYLILTDSVPSVTVGTTYDVPVSGMLYNIYSNGSPHGIVPSMACEPTGKLQVKIQKGSFPYYVDIWSVEDTGLVFWKTLTFDSNMYHGADSIRYDYQHYYTVDSLSTGKYRLLCHDGCGYYMPYLEASVPKVRYYDHLSNHLLRNSSGIPTSSNILTFKEVRDEHAYLGSNDDYYRQTDRPFPYQYRFVNPTLGTESDTTPWHTMPDFETATFLYDTLSALRDYGDIWGRDVVLQLRPLCGDTLFSYSFTVYNQGNNGFFNNVKQVNKHYSETLFDFCGYDMTPFYYDEIICGLNVVHLRAYCTDPDSLNCHVHYGYTLSGGIPNSGQGAELHSYITLPLRHKVINVTQDTVVSAGVIEGEDYLWSALLLQNMDLHGDSVIFEITDYHYNPLITEMIRFSADTTRFQHNGARNDKHWERWEPVETETFCPDSARSIGIYFEGSYLHKTLMIEGELHYQFDRDTICLIESPGNNRYNFTGIPDQEGDWTIIREQEANHAVICKRFVMSGVTQRMALVLTDTNLLPGRYVWVVKAPCPFIDTMIIEVDYDLPYVSELPEYEFDTTCTALNITPLRGMYSHGGVELETFFQVTQADTLAHTASAVKRGEVMSVGVPGNYRICMYTLPHDEGRLLAKNPCYAIDTVIEWNYVTVQLEYIYGHVCTAVDTVGFVRAKGINGKSPYTYRLYSAPGGSGDLIAENMTGVFDHIPVRYEQTVSVEITDACNAHFITNLTISDMDKIRKCWAEDNKGDLVLNLGDTCRFYGLSLGDVSYRWTGPDGYIGNTQNVVVLMGSEACSGAYCIAIEGGGCGVLSDSVMVQVRQRPCPGAVDYDGNSYAAVRINGLCWTQANLRSEHYSDGRPVTVQVYRHPDFSQEQMVALFGLLYEWEDAADTAHVRYADAAFHLCGVCPEGWYLPTREQYEALYAWGAPALRAPSYWIGNLGGTNETGFSALPAGFYNGVRDRYENLLGEARFWSANPLDFSENVRYHTLVFPCSDMLTSEKCAPDACSVRCILAE